MATGELPDMSWLESGSFEAEFTQSALLRVYEYYRYQQDEAGLATSELAPATDVELSLNARWHGNGLNVRAFQPDTQKRSVIAIGYYSPIDGDFIVYPEMLADDGVVNPDADIHLIKSQAFPLRAEEIERFNNHRVPMGNRTSVRLDYENKAVQLLQREHYGYLDGYNLSELLDEYNFYKAHESPDKRIFADECTRACICFTSTSDKHIFPVQNRFLSVKVQGAYRETNDVQLRVPETFIRIAERRSDDGDSYVLMDPLIPDYELDSYVELGQSVLDLAARYSGDGMFSTQQVAINVAPQSKG